MSPKGSPAPRGGRSTEEPGHAGPGTGDPGSGGPGGHAPTNGGPSFETALARLEEIVTRLERGEITLDESLAAFKEGSGLVRHCLARLEAAEVAVQQLAEGSAGDTLKPFDARLADGGKVPNDSGTDD